MKYCEKLYAHKFDNLHTMELLIERHELPKLTQGKTVNHKRSISTKAMESIINSLTESKAPGSDRFTGKFYQTFKQQMTPILCNLFQKIEAKITLLTHSMNPESS